MASLGAGLAIWATDDWDDKDSKADAGFELDAPSPFVMPRSGKDRGLTLGVNLLQGRF